MKKKPWIPQSQKRSLLNVKVKNFFAGIYLKPIGDGTCNGNLMPYLDLEFSFEQVDFLGKV